MDINIKYLKAVLKQRMLTFEGMALAMGCARSTLFRKLRRGKQAVTLQDYITIKTYLNLTPDEAKEIFGEI